MNDGTITEFAFGDRQWCCSQECQIDEKHWSGRPLHVTCTGKLKKLTEQCHINDNMTCNYYPSAHRYRDNTRSHMDICDDNR